MTVFGSYSQYYNLLYKDKDYAGEEEYVHKLIQKYRPGSKTILNFGCGTGHHDFLLAEKGYEITGVDMSEEMIDVANSHLSSLAPQLSTTQFVHGDIRNIKLDKTFDAVTALFHVISYQTSNEDLLSTFQNAYRHLNTNGILLFDVWYTPTVLKQRPAVRVKRMEDEHVRLMRVAEPIMGPNENIVEVIYTIFIEETANGRITRLSEIHRMRHFTFPELAFMSAQAGFTMIRSEEFLTGNELNENTWGACFALQKSE